MSNPTDGLGPLPPRVEELLHHARQDPPLAAEVRDDLFQRIESTVGLAGGSDSRRDAAAVPFGRYHLLERINAGGMAEVFKAKIYGLEGFERFVALKRILPAIAEDEEFVSMFIDEAKIAVQLHHANIAQVFDLGKEDDAYYIAMEYVSGKDLRAIFDHNAQAGATMPLSRACFIIMKVCEGLDYAHNKRDGEGRKMRLVHRDVSLQNVLVSFEGEVKLVDFGIAKAVGKASSTQAGILKGKFGYMSPEQVRGLPLDRRSDIFSVGICLYELLTGERLFQGESDFSTLEKVRNVEILPPSAFNREVPEELERIVLKALSSSVEERYEQAMDLHDDLQAFLYSNGAFCSCKDLAAWMNDCFADDIAVEERKLALHRRMLEAAAEDRALQESQPPPPPRGGLSVDGLSRDLAGLALFDEEPAPALTWDDDEVETDIFDGATPPEVICLLEEDAAGPDAARPEPKPEPEPEPEPEPLPLPEPLPTFPVEPRRPQHRWGLAVWMLMLLLVSGASAAGLMYVLDPPRSKDSVVARAPAKKASPARALKPAPRAPAPSRAPVPVRPPDAAPTPPAPVAISKPHAPVKLAMVKKPVKRPVVRKPVRKARPKKVKQAKVKTPPASGKAGVPRREAAYGYLLVGSKPWTRILVDGKDTGLHTPRRIPLRPGKHTIYLRNAKHNINWSFQVTIRSGQTYKVVKRFATN